MKKALIFHGGWDGHDPVNVSKRVKCILEDLGFEVTVTDTMDLLKDADYLKSLDLIFPCWTMGEIPGDCCRNISQAVAEGTSLAGVHGGMCDAFRNETLWQFMTGAQFVDHPGGPIKYRVNILDKNNPLTKDIEDFDVVSEQYYMHYDPAVEIYATTDFPSVDYYNATNKPVKMPVIFTKYWGKGKVFYTSLGHTDEIFEKYPEANQILKNGLKWASEKED